MTAEYLLAVMEKFPDAELTVKHVEASGMQKAHTKWRVKFVFADRECVAFGKTLPELISSVERRIDMQIDEHTRAARRALALQRY